MSPRSFTDGLGIVALSVVQAARRRGIALQAELMVGTTPSVSRGGRDSDAIASASCDTSEAGPVRNTRGTSGLWRGAQPTRLAQSSVDQFLLHYRCALVAGLLT